MEPNQLSRYLNHVAKEVLIPSDNFEKFGKLKTKAAYCLKASSEVDIEMVLCRHHMYDRNMMFEMDKNGVIFRGNLCYLVNGNAHQFGMFDFVVELFI